MANIERITTTIEAGSVQANSTDFGTPLIVTFETVVFSAGGTYATISDLSQITSTSTVLYSMVESMFAQSPRISKVNCLVLPTASTKVSVETALKDRKGDIITVMLANSSATTTDSKSRILWISDWCENNAKLFLISIDDSSKTTTAPFIIKDGETGSIAGNSYTLAIVHDNISQHIEAGVLSKFLSYPIGNANFGGSRIGSQIVGATPNNFTLDKSLDIIAKNANQYTTDAGVNLLNSSVMLTDYASDANTSFRSKIGRLWISAEIVQRLKTWLFSQTVATYTQETINEIESVIIGAMDLACQRNLVDTIPIGDSDEADKWTSSEYKYKISIPTKQWIATNAPSDITQQTLSGIEVDFTESGDINKIGFALRYYQL